MRLFYRGILSPGSSSTRCLDPTRSRSRSPVTYKVLVSEEWTNPCWTVLPFNSGKYVAPEKERQPPVKAAGIRSAKIVKCAETRVQGIEIGNTKRNVTHGAVQSNIRRGEIGSRIRADAHCHSGQWLRYHRERLRLHWK